MRTSTPIRRTTAAALCAVVLAACGQPSEPLDIGIREVASDIVLGGGPEEVAPVAGPVTPPTPTAPSVVAISVPVPPIRDAFDPPPAPVPTPTRTPTPAVACPEDDPLEAPAREARGDLADAPVEEQLVYRNVGTRVVSGPNATDEVVDHDSIREVTDVVVEENGDLRFAVTDTSPGVVTTTRYRVVNEPPPDELVALFSTAQANDTRGLYLTGSSRTDGDGTTTTFAPQPPLLLLPFPATLNHQFSSAGTDPLSGTTMSFDARVGERVRVNACGEPLVGFEVSITNGRITGPGSNLQLTGRYVFAPQYGGMPILEELTIAGTVGQDTIAQQVLTTISQLPTYGPAAGGDGP